MANHRDRSLLRNETAYELGRIFDNMAWTPHSDQVQFYLNGKYQGLYQMSEAIKIDKNRVDVEEISVDNPGGGWVMEVDHQYNTQESFKFTTNQGDVFIAGDPDADLNSLDPVSNKTLREIMQETVQRAETAIYKTNAFSGAASEYLQYIDVDSFVDYYLVEEIVKNRDGPFVTSVYMYYDPADQKLHMGPLWDFDISFGNFNSTYSAGNFNITNNFLMNLAKPVDNRNSWLGKLYTDPYFKAKLVARWNEKRLRFGL
jgi:spore coat protein CotH